MNRTHKDISIQKRLHNRVLLVSLILVFVFLLIAYKHVRHETEELFDAQLARSARLILSLAQAEITKGMGDIVKFQQFLESNRLQAAGYKYVEGHETLPEGHLYETKLAFSVANAEGETILHSHTAPAQLAKTMKTGYATRLFDNDYWRVFRLNSIDDTLYCVTAERIDVRNDLIYKISSDLIMLFIALLVILAIVIWFAIGNGLAPLWLLAEQIQRRNVDNLSEVDLQNVPTEVRSIVTALNQLFKRLGDALTRERHITSDAAHELRTPLAAVKLHAELALSTTDATEKNKSLQFVLDGVNRSSHLVDQLLKLARLEPDAVAQQHADLDFSHLLQEIVEQHQAAADARNIDLSHAIQPDIHLYGDTESLKLMVRNLLDNAISYTQRGGRVWLSLVQQTSICLIIEDNGPGIKPEKRERIFERFYRIENHEKPGCGIGMAIVARVCELHHANIELLDPPNGSGLVVKVCFPAKKKTL